MTNPDTIAVIVGEMSARDEVMALANFFEGVRVFVTSRQKIKHPEGTDLFDEHVTRLLRLADRLGALGWRPIEMAPKDGSYILVTNGEPDGCFVVCWYEGGWRYEFHRHDGAVHMNCATHWMPLPAAPTGVSHD